VAANADGPGTSSKKRSEGLNAGDDLRGQNGAPETLVIDHDHETGKARGFLCRKCNYGLGAFDDDLSMFRRAAQYLDRHHARRD